MYDRQHLQTIITLSHGGSHYTSEPGCQNTMKCMPPPLQHLHIWPWTLTSDLEKFFSNSQWYDAYLLSQVSLNSLHVISQRYHVKQNRR